MALQESSDYECVTFPDRVALINQMAADGPNPLRDPESFGRFYSERSEDILRFFARRVYDAQVAMDLTAETFAQAFLARNRFRRGGEKEAVAWLYVIARRQLSRFYRRGQAERRALQRLGISAPELSAADQLEIAEMVDLPALRAAVQEGFAQLSSQQRDALRLRIVEERPYGEIAQSLGISEQAARARVSRGLRALARAIDRKPTLKEAVT